MGSTELAATMAATNRSLMGENSLMSTGGPTDTFQNSLFTNFADGTSAEFTNSVFGNHA
jgi:hypothetical protein